MQRNQMMAWLLFTLWILTAIVGVLHRELGATPMAVQFGLLALFVVAHGRTRYQLSGSLVFVGIVFAVAMIFEMLSIHTGFPFGFFTHSNVFGFKVFEVPLLVGVAYAGNAYLAWITACILLNKADKDHSITGLIGVPVIAAFIVSALDATYDPGGSTFAQYWSFNNPGGYFGVPVSNFIGWLVTSYVFYQLFALYQRSRKVEPVESKSWWAMPPILLCVYGLQQPVNLLTLPNVAIVDPHGVTWQSQALFETTTLVSVFTVIFCAILAGFLIAQRQTK